MAPRFGWGRPGHLGYDSGVPIEHGRRPGCPKRMVSGPCGGVRPDGSCEIAEAGPCVFVADPFPPAGGVPAREPGSGLRVVTDLHVAPRDRRSVEEFAALVQGSCDAVLVPDHGARHGDFPPPHLASILMACGLRPWVTLSCRDRNRAALAADCAALADMGVAGVHCVTGDWQETGEAQVFDLDALHLVEVAVAAGLSVSVAATPAAPPVAERPRLLARKAAAGATVAFINHCGGPGVVGAFAAAVEAEGVDMELVACVPVLSDRVTASRLAALPGLVLDPAAVEAEVEAGRVHKDPVDVAVAAAAEMLAQPRVSGVNLSGAASLESFAASAQMMARVGREVRSHERA